MHRVFVYGSLMGGQTNHGLLTGSRFLGAARTPPRYTLVDLGPYPGMIAGGQTPVEGELYEVDAATLAELDRLEEHPRVYVRAPILLADGSPVLAYLLRPDVRRGAPEIRSGRWLASPAGTR